MAFPIKSARLRRIMMSCVFHDPELFKKEKAFQIWNDAEVTTLASGSAPGNGTLIKVEEGLKIVHIHTEMFPHPLEYCGMYYAFTNESGYSRIRDFLMEHERAIVNYLENLS